MKSKNTTFHLSLVIPLYNEEKRLALALPAVVTYLKKQRYSSELVLVDDGSRDRTLEKVARIVAAVPHQILKSEINKGKGSALKRGILASRGECVVFSDVDFSTPITELPKLLSALRKHEVAIGVRRHKESRVLRHQSAIREYLGHVFTLLTNVIATPGIIDATCGFKGFQRKTAMKLFSKSKIGRWAFDAEVLFLARKYGCSVAQVPVVWSDNQGSKVHMVQDGVLAFADLLKIRLNDWIGLYQ